MVDLKDFVEVKFKNPDDFLMIKETLTRIGIPSKNNKTLYQSCHILHKQGKYYILHFKEIFKLDGKPSTITLTDIQRRNTIAKLLRDWGLLELVNPTDFKEDDLLPTYQIRIIKTEDKKDWNLVPKYNIGKKF